MYKKLIYKYTFHTCGGNNVQKVLKDNWVSNYINAYIKSIALLIPKNAWY